MTVAIPISFDAIATKLNRRVDDVVKTIAMELFGSVIDKTPVDTGRLRGNWFVSTGTFVAFSPDAPDPSGDKTRRYMQQSVLRMRMGEKILMTNSLPYAAVVEYGQYPNPPKHPTGKTSGGYSIQAPAGMVRVSMQEITAQLGTKFGQSL